MAGKRALRPRTRHGSAHDCRDAFRVLPDLAPAEAQDAPTGELERRVAGAVALERRRTTVERVAVDLDDQPPRRPREVHFEPLDAGVDLRMRQPRSPAKVQELLFEGTTGGSRPP